MAITGAIKVLGLPNEACYTSWKDLFESLGKYLGVEIPDQAFSNVVISNTQPNAADRNKIWWRLSNSGTFIGVYWYANNVWSQIFPASGQITWVLGDSANPPAGYSFTAVQAAMTAPDYAILMNQAVPAGLVGPYTYFPTLWTGI